MNGGGLHAEWLALRKSERGLHGLEIADRLRVSECELLASACNHEGEVQATRLVAPSPEMIARLAQLGFVKAVTRNRRAVIEIGGRYDDIDLTVVPDRWKHAFAFRDETRRGLSRGLAFFDANGVAIHKVFLRDASDHAAYEALVGAYRSPDQSTEQIVEPEPTTPPPRPDGTIDVLGLREAWLGMDDATDLPTVLRKLGVARRQAFRLLGDDIAYRVETTSLEEVLRKAAASETEVIVSVGNPAVLQVFSGRVFRIVPLRPWINVIDPTFDLHVRTDRIDTAWVVRTPTDCGFATSLELFTGDGELIAHLVGKRRSGQRENPVWRSMLEGLVAFESRKAYAQ